MKKYQPQTIHYRELLAACREELRLLGYRAGTAKLNGAAEFLQRMEAEGKTRLEQIERTNIEQHIEHLRARPQVQNKDKVLSPYTIQGYVFSLRLLFDYAERHGLRGGSPLAGLRLPSPPKSERYVATGAEIATLYRQAQDDPRLTAILHLLYGCGLRRSEAASLDLGDVDHRAATLYVRRGKGRKRRVIPLSKRVATGLRHYQKRDRWCWANQSTGKAYLLNDRGRRMRGNTIAKHLSRLVLAAKVNRRITPHALRHAIATHLLESGMELERVRDFLGHDHLETTQVYTRIKTEEL